MFGNGIVEPRTAAVSGKPLPTNRTLQRFLPAGVILLGLLLAATLPVGADALPFTTVLTAMQARLADTVDYQCRLETWSTNGEKSRRVVLAYAFHSPAKVRVEVLEGPYAGSLLIYDRERDPNRVRALAGNPVMAFLQRMFYGEVFAVDHPWVVDLRGEGIHESHWPHFAAERRKYLQAGRSRFLGEAVVDGRKAYRYRLVFASEDRAPAFHREDVWVDAASYFPVQYRQYDTSGRLVRWARVTGLQFDTGIGLGWFRDFQPQADGQ